MQNDVGKQADDETIHNAGDWPGKRHHHGIFLPQVCKKLVFMGPDSGFGQSTGLETNPLSKKQM
jgi:hypothetical protein